MDERLSAEDVYALIRIGEMSEEEFIEWTIDEYREGYGCGANSIQVY